MRRIYFIFLLFVLPVSAFAQFEIDNSGNWNTAGIWVGGVPASTVNDNVLQDDGFSVTVPGTDQITAGSLTTGFNNTLVVQGPSGSLTLGSSSTPASLIANGNDFAITIQSGASVIIWGDLDVQTYLSLTIQPGGQLIVKGNVNIANNATLAVNGNMEVDGAFNAGFFTNVQVNGTVSVFGQTTVGTSSTEGGAGTFHAYGGCSGPSTFCGTLPVELLFFHAEAKTASVTLTWATASEINFDYFLIEKSFDGITFNEIASVAGKGSTRGRTDYSLDDEKPATGRSYYRLTEVDLDKSVHHLLDVAVNFSGEKTFSMYPNPVTNGQVNFELNFVPETSVLVSIVDLRGRTLTEFAIDQPTITLPVQLTSGLYLVTMRSGNFSTVSKLVVK
jgi:hypothetical protein